MVIPRSQFFGTSQRSFDSKVLSPPRTASKVAVEFSTPKFNIQTEVYSDDVQLCKDNLQPRVSVKVETE